MIVRVGATCIFELTNDSVPTCSVQADEYADGVTDREGVARRSYLRPVASSTRSTRASAAAGSVSAVIEIGSRFSLIRSNVYVWPSLAGDRASRARYCRRV